MVVKGFFEERSEQSRVKAELVEKYFVAWAKVLKRHVGQAGCLAYIDLFAGPGRYKDGAVSVPLIIVEKAIADDFLRDHLVTIFNDKDENHTRTLEQQIEAIQGVETLRYKPQVVNEEVGDRIIEQLEGVKLAPTLFFVDPWGYKGLSLRLINSVLRNWGCDCIFFFNYNRINPGLSNPFVEEHIDALFQKKRADVLRFSLAKMAPAQRELAIVEAISQALKDMGGRYVLPFTFKRADGSRTTHYLIFVSKHVRGYEVMKDIMARASSGHNDGVPSFSYCEAGPSTPLLFEFARPLNELGAILCKNFAGQSLRMHEVYDRHHVDRPFIKKNYKQALARLEADGRITAEPPAAERPKRQGESTFADTVRVKFPGAV